MRVPRWMALGMTAGSFQVGEASTAGSAGKSQPDLVVSSIGFTSPASPVPGQSVTFSCVAKNAGKGNVASRAVIGVGYPAGNPSVSALRAAGVRWVRVEWKAARGYSFYDPLISAYRAEGVSVLLLVDYVSTGPSKPACLAPDGDWLTYRGTFTGAVSEDR